MCTNFQVFRIRNGSYHGVNLSGSVFILMNLPVDPGKQPVAHTLFVDANDATKIAATQDALRNLFGFAPPNVLGTSIKTRFTKATEDVSIDGLLSYRVSFDQERGLSPGVSENLYDWLSNPRQGIVRVVLYSPPIGATVKFANTNAISGTFHIQVPPE